MRPRRVPMVLALLGPSGVGKSTAASALVRERDDVVRVVTATSRPRRPGEVDGVDYLFLDPLAVRAGVRSGRLVAPTVYDGASYAVPAAAVASALDAGWHALVVVDAPGVEALRVMHPGRVVAASLEAPRHAVLGRLSGRDGAVSAARAAAFYADVRSARAAGAAPVPATDLRSTLDGLHDLLDATRPGR